MDRDFHIAYNSDLVIKDPSEAATLCVFYDKVYLPYTTTESQRRLIGRDRMREDNASRIERWELEYGTLFDAGVLRRLMPPADPEKKVGLWESRYITRRSESYVKRGELVTSEYHLGMRPEENWDIRGDRYFRFQSHPPVYSDPPDLWTQYVSLFEKRHGADGVRIVETEEVDVLAWPLFVGRSAAKHHKAFRIHQVAYHYKQQIHDLGYFKPHLDHLLSVYVERYESGLEPFMREDLAVHLLRTDVQIPQIFTPQTDTPSRDILVALEATATFNYLLPKLRIYHPTQILELRDKVKDTREGFTMHLWKLSKGLEQHAQNGTSMSEVARYAADLIQTDLIPDYREFQRQLVSLKAGWLNKVLDPLGKIVEISATPWTPKFWAQLFKAIGLSTLASEAEKKEELSNKYQAFKFMSQVEGSRWLR